MKTKDMEVWCVEQQEINTIGYFAEKLGIKKIYNIKDVLNNPDRTAGGCHFCTPEYGLDNPEFVEKPKQVNGYRVKCIETGEEWPTVSAAIKEKGFSDYYFRRYLDKVDSGEEITFEGKHYEIIEVGVKMQHENAAKFANQLRRPELLNTVKQVEGEKEKEFSYPVNTKIYIVYVHKNKVNGKCYVGITSNSPEVRWQNGNGYKTQPKFYNAIKKYGWDGFYHQIMATRLTEEKAKQMEQRLIKYYDSFNNGYNATLGGDMPTIIPKPVMIIETGTIYQSAREAAEVYETSLDAIYSSIRRGYAAAGYHWCYAEGEALENALIDREILMDRAENLKYQLPLDDYDEWN